MQNRVLPEIREIAAEAPWIAYFLGCAVLCILGIAFVSLCRFLCGSVLRIAVALAMTFLLAGCDPILFSWQGPSPEYPALDIDADAELSREEWERWHGTSSLSDDVLDFDRADCDRNGRLTWREYFELRFRGRRCAAGALENLALQSFSTLAREDAVVLLNARDVDQARVSLIRSRQQLIDARYHEGYAEADLPVGPTHLFHLSCAGEELLQIPETSRDYREITRISALGAGVHPAIRCTVRNRMKEGTITCLRLRFGLKSAQGPVRAFHAKTLWIPPGSSRDFWVFPRAGHAITAIDLVAVRVQGP